VRPQSLLPEAFSEPRIMTKEEKMKELEEIKKSVGVKE